MLRAIFVITLIITGGLASLRGPFYALLFYLWIAYFRPESWIWDDFLKGSGLSMYVGIYLAVVSLFSKNRLIPSSRVALLGLFLVHSLISTMMSDYFSYCWPYWIQFAKVLVITYLITVLVKSDCQLKWVILTMALSLGFEGAKQGWAQMILNPGAYNQNPNPFLGDNNGVAIGMLMLVPLLLALVSSTTKHWLKGGYGFLAVGVAYRALTTYSRGGFLTFIAMLGLHWTRSRHKLLTLVVVLALAVIILPIFPRDYWQRMQTITAPQEELDASSVGRLYFWGIGLEMAKENPILGVGHQGFKAAYDDFDLSIGKWGTDRAIHSMWFGILAESGFTGLLLFILIFYQSWRGCIRARALCRDDQSKAFVKQCATAIETGLLAAAVGGTFMSFQYIEMLWHFFGLSIAIEKIALNPIKDSEIVAGASDIVSRGAEPVAAS